MTRVPGAQDSLHPCPACQPGADLADPFQPALAFVCPQTFFSACRELLVRSCIVLLSIRVLVALLCGSAHAWRRKQAPWALSRPPCCLLWHCRVPRLPCSLIWLSSPHCAGPQRRGDCGDAPRDGRLLCDGLPRQDLGLLRRDHRHLHHPGRPPARSRSNLFFCRRACMVAQEWGAACRIPSRIDSCGSLGLALAAPASRLML